MLLPQTMKEATSLSMSVVLRVAIPVPLPKLFDYLPPAVGTAQPGSRVLVDFGRTRMVGCSGPVSDAKHD